MGENLQEKLLFFPSEEKLGEELDKVFELYISHLSALIVHPAKKKKKHNQTKTEYARTMISYISHVTF